MTDTIGVSLMDNMVQMMCGDVDITIWLGTSYNNAKPV